MQQSKFRVLGLICLLLSPVLRREFAALNGTGDVGSAGTLEEFGLRATDCHSRQNLSHFFLEIFPINAGASATVDAEKSLGFFRSRVGSSSFGPRLMSALVPNPVRRPTGWTATGTRRKSCEVRFPARE